MFRVEPSDGHDLPVHGNSGFQTNFVKILPGDRVLVELSSCGLGRERVTYRFK